MTENEAFKLGFIARCRSRGLSDTEILNNAKLLRDKVAYAILPEGAAAALSSLGSTVGGGISGVAKGVVIPALQTAMSYGLPLAGAAAISAPLIAGSSLAFGVERVKDTETGDVDDVAISGLINEYERNTQQLKLTRQLRDRKRR
jgi:hypothetical protein